MSARFRTHHIPVAPVHHGAEAALSPAPAALVIGSLSALLWIFAVGGGIAAWRLLWP